MREDDEVVVTAYEPRCTAAILFSAQGLRKALQVLLPLFNAIDNMMANVCERRLMNCYKLRVPTFAQDMYWGSEWGRKLRTTTHDLDYHNSLCRERNLDHLLD